MTTLRRFDSAKSPAKMITFRLNYEEHTFILWYLLGDGFLANFFTEEAN